MKHQTATSPKFPGSVPALQSNEAKPSDCAKCDDQVRKMVEFRHMGGSPNSDKHSTSKRNELIFEFHHQK